MILQDLINLEEQWLIFKNEKKFDLSFNQYITLQKKIKEIGEITNHYFELMKEYNIFLQKQNLSVEEHKQKLSEYNEKLLNSPISIEIFTLPNLDRSKLK